MLSEIENFLADYPNIINFLVAIGTIGAVISSLYFSKLTLKPKIQAYLYRSELWLPKNGNNTYEIQEDETYISLSLSNKGIIPIYIPYFGGFSWYFPFRKQRWMQNPLNPIFRDKDFELLQYKSAAFVLCNYSEFIKNLKNDLIQKYKYPKFLLNFISFKIRTSNGEFIVAKLDKKLKKAIIEDIK